MVEEDMECHSELAQGIRASRPTAEMDDIWGNYSGRWGTECGKLVHRTDPHSTEWGEDEIGAMSMNTPSGRQPARHVQGKREGEGTCERCEGKGGKAGSRGQKGNKYIDNRTCKGAKRREDKRR